MKIHPFSKGDRRGVYIETATGWGEASPLPGFSRETYDQVLEQLQNFNREASLFPSVRFALDTAKNPIENHNVRIAHFGSDGNFHECIKIKLASLTLDEALDLVNKTLPLCDELRVDMNRAWPLEKAQKFCDAFPENTFAFIEEPTREIEKLKTHHPLAVDEHLREWPLEKALRYPYVVIKPTLMGGIETIEPVVSACKENSVTPILSSSYETRIGIEGIIGLHKRLSLDNEALGIGTL